jgi:peptide/nickel transport system substrate-binding protein
MSGQHEQPLARRAFAMFGVLSWLVMLFGTAQCRHGAGPLSNQPAATLRVGVGGLSVQAADAGLRQVVANLSVEGLVNFNEDGRPRPFLAESWIASPDGLTLTFQLHKQAKFHDGSPVTAPVVIGILKEALPRAMGGAYEDVADVQALDDSRIQFRLRRPAPLLIEALETTIQKPGKGGASVGPFVPTSNPLELTANLDYYQGRPAIDKILFTPYPTVRAAWAELLRGDLDMLYEVNADSLDSLQSSSNMAVFSFVRHYQYMIIFGPGPAFQSADLRRELNAVIDRDAVVRDGLNGHGVPSSGAVPPRHWALDSDAARFTFNPSIATHLPNRHFKFTCVVPADSVYERVALTVKRQLAAAGVDMQIKEITQDELAETANSSRFDAILVDAASGPSLFRSYRRWHSRGGSTTQTIDSPAIDAALDRVRHAASDEEYREGVRAFQQAIVDSPPAIFLAWGERARAVSRRFEVPRPEDGRDALATLRLWKPAADVKMASRN